MDRNADMFHILFHFVVACAELADVYPNVFRKRMDRWEEYKDSPEQFIIGRAAWRIIDAVKKANESVSENDKNNTNAQNTNTDDSNAAILEPVKCRNPDPLVEKNSGPSQVCITCSSDKESLMKQLKCDLKAAGKLCGDLL